MLWAAALVPKPENGVRTWCKPIHQNPTGLPVGAVSRNSVVKGEYLAWYSENVTFENCRIIGTQPLCYCKGLHLINCSMEGCDLAFERSLVEATITTPVTSIKNPLQGSCISVPCVNEIIRDIAEGTGEVHIRHTIDRHECA